MGTPASLLDSIATYNPSAFAARNSLLQTQAAAAPVQAQQSQQLGAEQITAAKLANQEKQKQLNDLDIIGRGYQNTDGSIDSLRKYVSQNGISGEGRVTLEVNHQKMLAGRLANTEAQNKIRHDAESEVANGIDAVNGIKDPTEQAAAYARDLDYHRTRLAQNGSEVQLPDTLGANPKATLDMLSGQLGHAAETTKIALEHQQGTEAEQKGAAAAAEAGLNKVKAEEEQRKLDLAKNLQPGDIEKQVGAAIDPTAQPGEYRRTVALAKNAVSNGLGMAGIQAAIKDGADRIGRQESAVAQAKATMPIKIETAQAVQGAGANAAAAGGGLDMMAEQALNGNFTSRNPILMAKVYNRASQLAQERGLTNQQVLMQRNEATANKTALTAVTKQYETLKPFADMAERNANVLESKAALIDNLGAPLLNTPLRELEQKFTGNKDVAAFKAALLPVQADFARILSSPTGGGVLTDESKREMSAAIGLGATPGQIKAALDVFRTDARNRKAAYEANLADLQGKTIVGNAGMRREQKSNLGNYRFTTDGGKTWQPGRLPQ